MLFYIVFIFFTTKGITAFDPTSHANWGLLNNTICGHSAAFRIIGGTNASLGAYPWIARIGYLTSKDSPPNFRCGAVILTSNVVLSAAHCVYELPNDLKVGVIRVGEHNTETDPDCENGECAEKVQDLHPAEIIIHAEYGNPPFRNDISIIRLAESIQFSNYVKPICLIRGEQLANSWVGTMTEVAGWGIYDIDDPKNSIILQTVKLPVVENTLCKTAFERYADIGEKQMCVGGAVGKDSCGGDSGGPLMKVDAVDGPPRYYLIGVVSFGAKKCGATSMPGVYTRLSFYMNWILDNLSNSTADYKSITSFI